MMTMGERTKLNWALARIRSAGIDRHGQLWVRCTGHGESAVDLSIAMDAADALLRARGWVRDEEQPIFRGPGYDWGQALRRV